MRKLLFTEHQIIALIADRLLIGVMRYERKDAELPLLH